MVRPNKNVIFYVFKRRTQKSVRRSIFYIRNRGAPFYKGSWLAVVITEASLRGCIGAPFYKGSWLAVASAAASLRGLLFDF